MLQLQDIATEVNRLAAGRPIGDMQAFRTTNRGLKRQNSKVFGSVRNDDWTFHLGGRDELQFNLGFESDHDKGRLRYGVAFSLETSRSLPDIAPLLKKLALFNDYLRQNPEEFADLWMWEYAPERGPVHRPRPIESSFGRTGVFVFLGGAGDAGAPDYQAILDTLDRLMPLYRFVEGASSLAPASGSAPPPLRPGCPARPVCATASLAERLLNINLRHNALQTQLHKELVSEYGYEHVGVEQPAPGDGGRIDVLVEDGPLRIIFEIKIAMSARGCIREAVGQLLDYGCWPGIEKTDRLVVVGEPSLTPAENAYLAALNLNFPRPIEYRSVALADT